MEKFRSLRPFTLLPAVLLAFVLVASSCGSADSTESSNEASTTEAESSATSDGEDADAESSDDAETKDTDSDEADAPAATTAAASCEDIAAVFVTKGSANADIVDPEVRATCTGDTVTVTSNGILDFPYVETSPGLPDALALEFSFSANPTAADAPTDVPLIGPLGVATNGVPIYGPTEGAGGDVFALTGGFTECGGHNGPTGYHFHTFDATGSSACMFSEAEASEASQLFGYALDGFPIYSGNYQFTSSYELTDESLFATDTWAAHTFMEGSGDLDQCNGRTDADGNYAYYTTDAFPYVLGCYTGAVEAAATTGGGGAGGGPGDGAGPPEDDAAGPGGGPDLTDAAASLGITVEELEAALGAPPLDIEAAAASLGITVEELEAVLPAPPGDAPGGG